MSEPQGANDEVVYKICPRSEWEAACALGVYRGSADDLRDGFIHLSRESQVAQTLRTHFGGQSDLVLVSVKVHSLGTALRYERSRAGELFPHLYGALQTVLARAVEPVDSDHRTRST